jgi:hypothetical protein
LKPGRILKLIKVMEGKMLNDYNQNEIVVELFRLLDEILAAIRGDNNDKQNKE